MNDWPGKVGRKLSQQASQDDDNSGSWIDRERIKALSLLSGSRSLIKVLKCLLPFFHSATFMIQSSTLNACALVIVKI